MLISYNELCDLVRNGIIDADPANINGASIDIRIGPELMLENAVLELEANASTRVCGSRIYPTIDLMDRDYGLPMTMMTMDESGYALAPGQVCLAHSMEVFNLPDDIACEFRMRSSIARRFLNGLLAMWCDPSWHGSQLTLELHNTLQHHALLLRPGLKIGQMIFWRCAPVPKNKSYAEVGRYNNQYGVVTSKGA